ncbi:MAG: MliC family protein [Acetobacteraceae bacterium]
MLFAVSVMVFPALVSAATPEPMPPCSRSWYEAVERQLPTGDGFGHGPDIGSDEWKSVIEFKLAVRDKPGVPGRDDAAWCGYIDARLTGQLPGSAQTVQAPAASGPSFPCDKVRSGSIEAMVCGDQALSALDRQMAEVYSAASAKAAGMRPPPSLAAEQRGWIKGRNDCWKSTDQRECVRDEYLRRIAELQASYRLVSSIGPVRFACDGNPANEVTVTFFRTEPSTMIAERGDSVSLMYQQPSGSGIRYEGRNESFREHQGQAIIRWGHGAKEMVCQKKP